ncbi:signal peptidase I [Terribacillus sp. DMT04]|uniref:signal peptidase I n=1 Tax=Terribacillus sp. DMT04 TaxID=2850441 RepID=UPI001C2BB050|nr:signal peptidase I [Terribacillus sp. DMT04]QXE03079.1 signal peptidase I [Terribacillus sp. DMT04]
MAKQKNEWLDWLKALVIAVIIAVVVRMFLFAPIVVDGPSMQPTLHDNDFMIVNKLSYHLHDPERKDIVVFHATEEKDYIKRVIGIPGDHVEMIDDTLYINGEVVEEPYLESEKEALADGGNLTNDFKLEDLPGNYEEIPEGYVLVLGDNRRNSTDSRYIGLIPEDQIVGKVQLTFWPLNRIGLTN